MKIRLPLMATAILGLLAAMWGGLLRIGWRWPALQPLLPAMHGPLMVSGFLGTLITLERAVALMQGEKTRTKTLAVYAAPTLSGLGVLFVLAGFQLPFVPFLFLAGSLGLVGLYIYIIRQHTASYTIVMGVAALLWATGNALWLSGQPVFLAVKWWAGFLILTIAGERLEFGRLLRLSRFSQGLFIGSIGSFILGLGVSNQIGRWFLATGLLGLALWLLYYDIARKTIKKPGLPRFVAVCLLSGYLWLGFSGILLFQSDIGPAGFRYDAFLHTIFLGFIMSMIFGHAPIIFPAITGRPIQFHMNLYFPLGLLHLSLAIRIIGDLIPNGFLRTWGGLLNAIGILLYLGLTARNLLKNTS